VADFKAISARNRMSIAYFGLNLSNKGLRNKHWMYYKRKASLSGGNLKVMLSELYAEKG